MEILESLKIIKCVEVKRSRYEKDDGSHGFITGPKVFTDYRRFVKDEYSNTRLDWVIENY